MELHRHLQHKALRWGQGDVHQMVTLTYLRRRFCWEAHLFWVGKMALETFKLPSLFCTSVVGTSRNTRAGAEP